MSRGVIWLYRQFLPITDKTPIISLGEGGTPLTRADRLAHAIGFKGGLYLKNEGRNPSGSFKDRGMVVAVAKALEEGAEMLLCASTGNTSASAAAYGAHVGLPVAVLVPKGGVASGKLSQAMAYGAQILFIDSGFDKCQEIVRELAAKNPKIALVNSIKPYRLEGQKTAAFEVWEELRRAPDFLFIPVGNAGNITAYWMGFKEYADHVKAGAALRLKTHYGSFTSEGDLQAYLQEYFEDEEVKRLFDLPKMMGYQAEGAAPIVLGRVVENPETVASAIRVGNPARWQDALNVVKESGGKIDSVTDEEILEAYEMIPRLTGIFCEPASAASVAGLAKAIREYPDFDNSAETVVVCVLTGNGLKDPDNAKKFLAKKRSRALPPDLGEVIRYLKL